MLIVLLARPELLVRRPQLAAPAPGERHRPGDAVPRRHRRALRRAGGRAARRPPERAGRARRGQPAVRHRNRPGDARPGLTVGGPTRRRRRPAGHRVDADALAALAAPASLQVLVASRLDLLPAPERSALCRGVRSSARPSPSVRWLQRAATGDELTDRLRELIGRDLLTTVTDRLSAEEGQYAFVQTVVRTVAYQTQSRRDRLQRHLAVVEYLESAADSDSELSTVIAQHLRDALDLVGPTDAQRTELTSRTPRNG